MSEQYNTIQTYIANKRHNGWTSHKEMDYSEKNAQACKEGVSGKKIMHSRAYWKLIGK